MKKIAVQLIAAPSILGLQPGGVEKLADSLLKAGLRKAVGSSLPVTKVATLNSQYNIIKDAETKCLNVSAIEKFSIRLGKAVQDALHKDRFAVVCGGDCSILIGIMQALKAKGNYGLVFLDAHADFYQPSSSVTGMVADMNLAIITGSGPDQLSNINNLKPYIKDDQVIHIGQRDAEETKKNGSPNIRDTAITCIDLDLINEKGMTAIAEQVTQQINNWNQDGCWIHFDTDVLLDAVNPAVDYRIHRGLFFQEVQELLTALLATNKMAGISITNYNPKLDSDQTIAMQIVQIISNAFPDN